MLDRFEQARRKLLDKYPGEFGFVREWTLGDYRDPAQRRYGELHLAKVLPDGTVTAVAVEKSYRFRSPGVNGKPASYFNVVKYPNARVNHRNGIVTYGFIQVL